MTLYALGELAPRIHPDAFVHPDATVIGDVTIGAFSSVWPSAVMRGDDEHASVTADAVATFLREHLSTLAEPLATTLGSSGLRYLAEAARALADRVGPAPSAAANPEAGRFLPVIQPLEDEDEIACDSTPPADS